jgi:hypothetical protein
MSQLHPSNLQEYKVKRKINYVRYQLKKKKPLNITEMFYIPRVIKFPPPEPPSFPSKSNGLKELDRGSSLS